MRNIFPWKQDNKKYVSCKFYITLNQYNDKCEDLNAPWQLHANALQKRVRTRGVQKKLIVTFDMRSIKLCFEYDLIKYENTLLCEHLQLCSARRLCIKLDGS